MVHIENEREKYRINVKKKKNSLLIEKLGERFMFSYFENIVCFMQTHKLLHALNCRVACMGKKFKHIFMPF